MSLLLEHRWEHALVAAVIEAAKESCPNCYLGRTAVQKLIYFLNVVGVPMQLRFRIHHYGPFCDELPGVLDWLQADEIVTDNSSEQSRYSDFSPGQNWPEIKEQYQNDLEQYQESINSIASVLGSMEPSTLELIATLDFCFRWIRARGGNGPWKDRTIEKFKEIKGDKFSEDDISEWYQRLVSSNLIEL